MNVLIIPEDFRKDQYIVRPLIKRMMAELGKPNANVRVCLNPLLGGVSEALKWEQIAEIIHRYRNMIDLFLLLVDRDGVMGRRTSLNALEKKAAELLPAGRMFLGENAWQEIEVWAIAGQSLPKKWSWQDIQNEVNPKEVYFVPLVRQRGLEREAGNGRRTLGKEAASNYGRVRARCKKDVEALEKRISRWLRG